MANNAGTTPETPTVPTPPGATPQAAEPEPQPNRPPTHTDLAAKNGMSRLDDGPAEVTSLAIAPRDDTVAIGYADGQTRLWLSDHPTFEPPTPGPRADGPIRRIQFDSTGRFLYLTCPGALIAATRDGRNRTVTEDVVETASRVA